jgi:prepilin-type N-terminal cleavage/methylation domain-containing protein
MALFLLLPTSMQLRLEPIRLQGKHRLGFTMIEVMLAITVVAILSGMMIPKIGRTLRSIQVNRAAAIVAGDMEAAFTLAARNRKPMRITWDGGTNYTVADRNGGTVRLSRALLGDSDIGTITANFNPVGPIDVFPHGVSTAAFTVTITGGTSAKAITVSTAGHVRVVN